MHGIRPFNEKQCQLCEVSADPIVTLKLYTRKYLVRMESSIVDFHHQLYITAIQKLEFNLPHVRIIGTHNCGTTHIATLRKALMPFYVFFHSYVFQ